MKKPIMHLDSTLPKTYFAPIDPETGEIDFELQNRMMDVATVARYEGEESIREKAAKEYRALKQKTTMKEVPYFCQYTFMMGAAYKGIDPGKQYGCHPDTWANVPDEIKASFEIFDADASRIEFENKIFH